MIKRKQQVVLLILDGWGIAPVGPGNAIELARKPNFDKLWQKYPHTQLFAHGHYVGLPDSQIGNSEAGHMNIGAGRKVKQDSVLISDAIADGRFHKNLALNQTIDFVKKNGSSLHLLGMISEKDSPHSSLEHLYALIDLAVERKVKNVYLHLITDGRDSPQFSALKTIDAIAEKANWRASIVTIMGRFYGMDRGKNWSRIESAYDSLTTCKGPRRTNYRDAVLHAYNQGITDEYIEPTLIGKTKIDCAHTRIKDDDGIIFFNLRSDRARQLAKCFVQKGFNKLNPGAFKRKVVLDNIVFCAFTDFGPDFGEILTAFPSPEVKNTLPLILKEKTQLYIAETEKYAHVTYFMNGGYADPVNGEQRIRIPSLKVRSYAEKPEMSVYKITKKVADYVRNDYEFIAVNFANPDMVGHTGDLRATIKAIEHVDVCLGKLSEIILKRKATLIVTADHGNAEKMLDLETDEIWTGHTTNKVPFVLVGDEFRGVKLHKGNLGNIAPTVYRVFDMKKLPKKINSPLFN